MIDCSRVVIWEIGKFLGKLFGGEHCKMRRVSWSHSGLVYPWPLDE
jgi:hypothetical protein